MMHFFSRRRGDDGFTLVETLAALLVFALMTMGLIPLLISSLQGADLSRSVTINKNAAVEAMERVRGLPYYVSFGSQNNKVDVLDLYFPKLAVEQAGWGQLYGANKYTTDCSNDTLANPACPRNIPTGTTLRYEAVFVNALGATVAPPASYSWNSAAGADVPPSQMLDMSITAMWTQRGRARSFKLQSLVGDRKFSGVKVRGDADVEFGVQVLTSYANAAGELSELLALGGKADSAIDSRAVSVADISVRAADIRLSKLPTDAQPTAAELASFQGAAAAYHAPPDVTPGATSSSGGTVTHTEVFDPVSPSQLMQVAGVDATGAGAFHARVANEEPSSAGTFTYSPGLGSLDFWVRTQVDPSNNDFKKLDVTQPAFSIRGKAFRGTATGVTGALEAADRRVETSATVSLTGGPAGSGIRILPTTFIAAQDNTFGGALIHVENFRADTICKATDDPFTASATATWSATLRYWVADLDPTEIVQPGYQVENLTGGPGGDPLEAIKLANPLVFDGNLPADDVYLFEDPDDPNKNGYLADWSSLRNVAGAEDPSGRITQAQIAGALKIDTAPTNPALPESGLNIQVGQLRCEAVDER
jgi:prepilin-type N-terminal cleavage/methylation domain-containing protein